MTTSPPDGFVAPLDAFSADDLAQAGGKAANLGELIRAGYRVPTGFVVTTHAYAAFLERSGLSSRIAGLLEGRAPDEGDAQLAARIRTAIADAEVPTDVRAAVVTAYLAAGAGPVAVRSSATAEDLPGAAFAGQQDTFLNIIGTDAVVDAVHRCWGSLWTERAITYRRRHGLEASAVRMAVVVQTMLAAEFAGVLLTANPVTGAREEIVVEASSGLGEAVVSGMVTPDHYVLDRHGQVHEWTPGTREVVVRSRAGGGVVHDTTQAGEAERLADSVVAELARVAVSVAEHFGRPQDIEWAYADGRVWLLQARPLTALPPPPLELNRIQRAIGRQVVEMLPVRPYPLDMSAWILPGLGRMVTRMLAEIPGLHVDFSEALPEVDGVVDRFAPPMPRPTRLMLTAPIRNVRRARHHDPAAWTSDPRFTQFEQGVRELADDAAATLPWADLIRVPRRGLDLLHVITDLRVDYLPRAGTSLLRLRALLWLLRSSRLLPSLVAGAPTRTADANRAVADLAVLVHQDHTLRRLFSTLDGSRLAEELRRAPELSSFRAAVEEVLAEYGHRETTSPMLVSSPTWSDAPEAFLAAVTALVGDASPPSPAARADDALGRLLDHPAVRRTGVRAQLRRAVEAARAGIAFREDTHFYGTKILPIMRRALLEMGRRLTDVQVLHDPHEVFHLRLEELEDMPDPHSASDATVASMRETVLRRSARREELSGVPLIAPAALFGHTSADDADAIVTGSAASGGRATGPVRVILDPNQFGRLRHGDVLVCPYTNPSWTPLFQRAAAVVADTGGPASHAAIVAREYGIPAVMGTGDATTALDDGQMVTVDGDRGRVTAVEAAGPSTGDGMPAPPQRGPVP